MKQWILIVAQRTHFQKFPPSPDSVEDVTSRLGFLFHHDSNNDGNATMNISPSTSGSSDSLLLSPFEHERGISNYNNFQDGYSTYSSPQQEPKNLPSINRHSVNNFEQTTGTAAFHSYPHHIV
jgi:hypothetical protein